MLYIIELPYIYQSLYTSVSYEQLCLKARNKNRCHCYRIVYSMADSTICFIIHCVKYQMLLNAVKYMEND